MIESDPRRTRAYQEARARFLATRAKVCHWCGKPVFDDLPKGHPRKATVDHLKEVDAAPAAAMDTSAWVVACHSCNSSRGAKYRNRRDNPRRSSRQW